jgi:hypothetical protein
MLGSALEKVLNPRTMENKPLKEREAAVID